MHTSAISHTTTCPECGSRLSGGACPACSLGQLLSGGGGNIEDYEDVTPTEETRTSDPGELAFGRYTLKKRLAAGGMGIVYVAEDRKLKRTVALKMIRGSTFANESELARFTLEAEAAAALDHPNIVPIYEIGHLDGQPFFTMKQIEGESLAQRLKRTGGTLPARELASLLGRIARAVHHAHQRGVLHRDLKPGNILLDKAGTPWLTDFGLAKLAHAESDLTLSSDHIGTPDYMSPEVAAGKAGEVSTACDVWALGVLLWEMLHGARPFHANGTVETLRRIVEEEPVALRGLRVDEDLVTLARRCMEKDPACRPVSAGEVADELERWLRGEPIRARRVTPGERFVKWVRRSKVLAALYGVLAVGGISSLLLWHLAENAVINLTQTNEQLGHTNDQLGMALRISTATKLAVDSRLQLREDPARALLLAVESVELTERHGGGVLPEAAEALHEVLQLAGGQDVSPFPAEEGDPNDGYISFWHATRLSAMVSPDGTRMLTSDFTDIAHQGVVAAMFDLGERESVEPLLRWKVLPNIEGSIRWHWSGDSRHLLVVENDDELRLWDLGAPGESAPSDPPPSRLLGDLGIEGLQLVKASLRLNPSGTGFRGIVNYIGEGEFSMETAAMFGFVDIDPARATPVTVSSLFPLPFSYGWNADYQVSPDGNWMLVHTMSREGLTYLYDLRGQGTEPPEGTALREWETFIDKLTFSPDSSWLAYITANTRVRLYDLRAGSLKAVARSGRTFMEVNGDVTCMAFHPDEQRIVVGKSGGELLVRPLRASAAGSEYALRTVGAPAHIVNFSADGRWMAAGAADRVVSVWSFDDLANAPAPLEFRGLVTPVMDLAFSPLGNVLVGTGMHCQSRLWDFDGVRAGASPRTFPGRQDRINDLAGSPDQRWVATACGDFNAAAGAYRSGAVKLLNVEAGTEYILGYHGHRSTAVAFSRDGSWLASTGRDGWVRVWDFPALDAAILSGAAPTEPKFVLDMTDTRLSHDRHLAFHPRGTLYGTTGDGVVFEWDLHKSDPDAQRRFHILHSNGYLLPDVSVSQDGRWLAVCRHGWDGTPVKGSTQYGNMVLLYDVSAPGPPVPKAELPAQFLEITNVDFSPDGRWLGAGASGAGATVWDLEAEDIAASRQVSAVSSHSLGGVAFSPNGRLLALGGSDGRLHLWDWRLGGQLRTITRGRGINTLAWLGDGELVSGGEAGRISLWETDIAVLKEKARRVAGRELSIDERRRFRVGSK